MDKLTQTGELLSDWLRTSGTLDGSKVWQLMDQLIDQVKKLHDSGQLHRDIRAETVWTDQHNNASLRKAAIEPLSCGANSGLDNLPPELEAINELLLPIRIDEAQKALSEQGHSSDPRRIDVYQLGKLTLKMLTGSPVSDYLINQQVKDAVPSHWQAWIDSALGYDETDRAHSCEQLQLKLSQFESLENDTPTIDPSKVATPPNGTGTDLHRDTSIFESKAARATKNDKLPFANLGPYRIDAKLGSGGMGDVYLGYNPRLDRAVAIKVLPLQLSQQPDFVQRFNSEARAAAKLMHPHIVPIYFIGEDNGYHFFVMAHVDGPSLSQLLKRRKKLEIDQALELVAQITTGLALAHEHGLIHRDIKPGNILLDSKTGDAKLADFGLVKSLGSDTQATATGVVMGTVDYIAPEQGRGQAVDGRTDLYSIGVLLYQLLSGKLPFKADSPTAMIFQHAFEQPTPLEEVAPGIPPAIQSIVKRLMQKAPDDRYQTAQALVNDLRIVRAGGELLLDETPVDDSKTKSQIISDPAIDSSDQSAEIATSAYSPVATAGTEDVGRLPKASRTLLTAIAGIVAVLLLPIMYVYLSGFNSRVVTPTSTPLTQHAAITKLNSASAAFGLVRNLDRRKEYRIIDFDVTGSDKLVVAIAQECSSSADLDVTYAGQSLTEAVLINGLADAGIYYLDNPADVASRGTISFKRVSGNSNGGALYAVSLAGTAPGCSDVGKGDVGNPFGALTVSNDDSFVMVAAVSDNVSNYVPTDSDDSDVSIEAPFVEVSKFNGKGNEMGSGLALVAELASSPAQDLIARLPSLSDRRDRETVVLAAFAPVSAKSKPVVSHTSSDQVSDTNFDSAELGPSVAQPGDAASGANRRIVFSEQDSWIDMLPIINFEKDAASGNWRRDRQSLISTPDKDATPLTVPITLNESYEIALDYFSRSPDAGFRLAFPIGSRRTAVHVGFDDGGGIALNGIDGFTYSDPRNPTAKPKFQLKPNQDHKVTLNVTLEGEEAQIRLKIDHARLIDWSGELTSILPPTNKNRQRFSSVPTFAPLGSEEVRVGKFAVLTRGSRGRLLRPAFEASKTTTSGHEFALDFNASSRLVTVDSLRLDSASPLTVEAWLSPREQTGNNRALVIMDRDALSSKNSRFQLAVVEQFWRFTMFDPETNKVHNVVAPEPITKWNKWTHVAGIFHKDKLELFVDGKSVATSADFPPPKFVGNLLRIGAKDEKNRAFQGLTSQVRLTKGVMYHGDFEPETTFVNDDLENGDQVLALYHLDEGVGNLTRDSSGNQHHGVIRTPRWVKLGAEFP